MESVKEPRRVNRFGVFKSFFAPGSIFTAEDRCYRLNWWQILGGIAVTVVVCLVLDRIGMFNFSKPILAILCSVIVALKLRWRLRKHTWFWATLAVYVGLAGGLSFLVKWNNDGASGPIIGGLAGVSVYGLFVAFHAFEQSTQSHASRNDESCHIK